MRYNLRKTLLCCLVAFSASAGIASAQNFFAYEDYKSEPVKMVTVKGTVTDFDGPIMGAVVAEQDSTKNNSTITDTNGKYEITVPEWAVIVISRMGYESQQTRVDGRKAIDVTLKPAYEEPVQTEKEVSNTGAAESVEAAKIAESRPISNAADALSGNVAGVTVTGGTAPGSGDQQIVIRGQASPNAAGPLVIVDGVESTLNSVNPQDIESMSVLKDAGAAAMYGARAANGVIVITTKKGITDSLKVSYNGFASVESVRYPRSMAPVSNYADYMQYVNEGYLNSGLSAFYAQSTIDEWRSAADPLLYPNTDYIRSTFQTGVAQNHTLSVAGGSEKIHVFTSFGYLNNPGVMQNAGERRYTGRINLEGDVAKWFTVGTNVNGYVANLDMGAGPDLSNQNLVPAMTFQLPDGRFGGVENPAEDKALSANNPLMRQYSREGTDITNNFNVKFYGVIKPFTGFSLTASYSYQFNDRQLNYKNVNHDLWSYRTNSIVYSQSDRLYVTNVNSKGIHNYADIVANYGTKFLSEQLNFGATLGLSTENHDAPGFSGTRYDLLTAELSAINAATGEMSTTGSSTSWAMNSFFGKVNLSWMKKYFLDVNFRLDGSSRFNKANRWGFFPSVSFAWRITEEDWMKGRGMDNLKLRLSYGKLGSNGVGNYASQILYNSANYVLGGTTAQGFAVTALTNGNLSWEITRSANAGLDFGLLKGHLNGSIDFFYKYTDNILLTLETPTVAGTSATPAQNTAAVRNRGVELSLGWNDRKGDFKYNVDFNISLLGNKVIKWKGNTYDISGAYITGEGYAMNSLYVLRTDRIIQSEEDMKIVESMLFNNPKAFDAYGKPGYGDLLYKDINGDGLVNDKDKEILRTNNSPKVNFGINLGGGWKGLDFSALIQGVAGAQTYWNSTWQNTNTVSAGYALSKAAAEGAWRTGRTDATYPRLLANGNNSLNTQISDFYVQKTGFLKLRNVQVGYTLPSKWTNVILLERVRLYVSLENYLTFTKFKGMDPESGGYGYPNMRQALFGANLTLGNKAK